MQMGPKQLPAQVGTSAQYGQAQALMDGQAAVPMGTPPTTPGGAAGQEAPPRVQPGSTGAFDRGTDRPTESIMGAPDMGTPMQGGGLAAALAMLAQQSGIPDLAALAQQAFEVGD
jgi:hypothetical protein